MLKFRNPKSEIRNQLPSCCRRGARRAGWLFPTRQRAGTSPAPTTVFKSNFWFYNSLNVKCLTLNFNDLYYDNMETGHALSLQPRLIQIYPVICNS